MSGQLKIASARGLSKMQQALQIDFQRYRFTSQTLAETTVRSIRAKNVSLTDTLCQNR